MALKKVTVTLDAERFEELKAYATSKNVSVDDAATLAANTGLSRLAALRKHAQTKAKETKRAAKAEKSETKAPKAKSAPKVAAKAAPKAKAAAKPAKAAAKSKAKPAAKAKPKAEAKSEKTEPKAAKRSPLVSSAKKGTVSRLARPATSSVGSNSSMPAENVAEVAQA